MPESLPAKGTTSYPTETPGFRQASVERAERLYDDLEAIWTACIPPGDFDGNASDLRQAYVELVLNVADLLAPNHEGRLSTGDIYTRLSNQGARQLEPARGGIGITRLANVPTVLVTETEPYERTHFNVGQAPRRIIAEMRPAGATPTAVADAAANLFLTGDLDTLNDLLTHARAHEDDGRRDGKTGRTGAQTGTPRGTGPGGPRNRAIDPIMPSHVVAVESVSEDAEGRFSDPSSGLDDSARCGIFAAESAVEDLKARSPDGGIIPWADIPADLYERIVEWAPVIAESEPLAAILQYNLFHRGRDENWFTEGENVGIPIPHELIFAAFGIAPQTGWDRGLSAEMLLRIYRQEVDSKFAWSSWHYGEGKARVIKRHGIPDDILRDAKELMLSPEDYDDWTYLITGKSANNRDWTPQLRDDRREIVDENGPVIEPPASTRRIQEYLNGLDQATFGHGGYGIFKSEAVDRAIWTVAETIDEEERRDQELRKLYWLRRFPQPLYMVCDRFPRLKADHHNQAMNLPSDVLRSMYTARDYELDLSKAHLASYVPVAERYGLDVPVLKDYLDANLSGDIDLWNELAGALDTDVLDSAKARRKAVKRAYSAVYGSARQNMLFQILKEYGKLTGHFLDSFSPIRPLLDHELIDELFSARDKLEVIINERGGLEDADGRFIPLSAWDEVKDEGNRWRGVMAYVNASFEQKLMAAAFDEARKEEERSARSRFRIWLYQADGFTVRIGSKASHEAQVKRLQKAVADKAEALGMPTELEIDFTPE